METISLLAQAMPLTVSAALIAYLAAGAALVSGPARGWFRGHLVMPKPSNQSHVGALDALRGLAAVWVVSFHSWQWWAFGTKSVLSASTFVQAGNKAVPVFVALSGFLIYRAVRGIGSIDDLRRYYWNRILRIVPLYVASGVAIIAIRQLGGAAPPAGHGVAELFMLRSLGYPLFANPPLWSLYVEIVFYLVAPLFVIATSRQATVAAVVMLAVLALSDGAGPREFELWKYFCVGILASELHHVWRGRVQEWQAVALIAAGALWLAADIAGYGWLETYVRQPNGYIWPAGRVTSYTLDLAAAAGLILTGATLSRIAARITEWAPLRIVGAISFSLFVWHSMLIMAEGPLVFDGGGSILPRPVAVAPPPEWFRLLVMLPAFLAVAAVSFVLIEKPFLKLRRRRVVAAPVAAAIG
jgi:peptidoglycan/LPS O-acetylase OafA/YrhL